MKANLSADSTAPRAPTSPLVVELAGLRRRLASLLYEALLVLGILALTFMIPHLALGMVLEVAAPGWLMWLHLFAVLGLYFVWCWSRSGQTLAMQTWYLRLVRASDGCAVPARVCWLRYALAWPSVLLFGVGLWWALIDRERQFLHDRLAGTRIVLLPRTSRR